MFVDSAAFSRLHNLVQLDLSYNQITEIQFPPVLDRLQELRVASNQFEWATDFPARLPSARLVDLGDNYVEIVPSLEIYNTEQVRFSQ